MADTRLTELEDLGANAAAGDALLIHDVNNSYDKYINIDDFFTSLWAMNQAFTIGAKLTAGAVEIEGSAFDINGGTSDNLVINGGTIGVTTPITNFKCDNIQINGNTISSTAGTDLNITPLAGQQIVLDGTIIIDAGVVTGVTSLTSTVLLASGSSVITTIDSDTVTVAKKLAFDGTPEDQTGAGEIEVGQPVTQISTGAGDAALTIADGTTEGQIKFLYMVADGGGDATLSEAGYTLVFDDVNEGAILIWDNLNSFWRCVGTAGATFTP